MRRDAHHHQPTDYKVPVVPKKLGADGSMSSWDAAADAARREAEAARHEAAATEQHAERERLLMELRARGGELDVLWGLAHTRLAATRPRDVRRVAGVATTGH